jgi:ceramide glucosyltransferase
VILTILLWASIAYYLAALLAALRFRAHHPSPNTYHPVSILKPVRGQDPDFYRCIRSHADQDYPEFELLFAVRDPADPAIPEIRRLAAEFPHRRIEVFLTSEDHGPNAKVNGLERLRRETHYDLLVVSDSDIRVEADYLRRVTAPLSEPRVGMVTCPYRGVPAQGLPSLLEALWISTDFQVSVLVARLLGIQFALGATMAFRRADLDRIGGFAPLAAYLADDFWLGQKIHQLGRRILLSDYVVETVLPPDRWRDSWRHRLRWGRTLRVCRTAGYAGALITFAVPLAAAAGKMWPLAAAAVGLRMLAGLWVGRGLLGDRLAARYIWLIPLADLVSFAVWAASLFGRRVTWRGVSFRLHSDGRITQS